MARVLVLTDRPVHDSEWKGFYIWNVILSLAESQHEVLVLTTLDPSEINVSHPRLQIAQPASHWRVDQLTKWTQAIMQFRPEIVHTFALNPQNLWSGLTVWPYLYGVLQAFPRVRRISTFFDEDDISLSSTGFWHTGADQWTLFMPSSEDLAKSCYKGPIDLAPLELNTPEENLPAPSESRRVVVIPAPVSEWVHPQLDLFLLNDFLERSPQTEVHIVGGWGTTSLLDRKTGWQSLSPHVHRVQMLGEHTPAQFMKTLSRSHGIWLGALSPKKWKHFLSAQLAHQMRLPVFGGVVPLVSGSTANFLSRLYSTP